MRRLVRSDGAVASVWDRVRPALKRTARRLTDDRDTRDELLQEALIALWRYDPTRLDLSDAGDRRFLLRCLRNRMYDVYRAESLRRPAGTCAFPELTFRQALARIAR